MKEKIRILAALILAVSMLLPAGVTYSVTVYNVSGTDGEIYVADSYDPATHQTTSKLLSGTELNADVVMNDTVTPGYENHGTVGLQTATRQKPPD